MRSSLLLPISISDSKPPLIFMIFVIYYFVLKVNICMYVCMYVVYNSSYTAAEVVGLGPEPMFNGIGPPPARAGDGPVDPAAEK